MALYQSEIKLYNGTTTLKAGVANGELVLNLLATSENTVASLSVVLEKNDGKTFYLNRNHSFTSDFYSKTKPYCRLGTGDKLKAIASGLLEAAPERFITVDWYDIGLDLTPTEWITADYLNQKIHITILGEDEAL